MGFECGIVGLPNAGKSTLFNLLTATNVPVAPHPFTTIEPHVGISVVKDKRLDALKEVLNSTSVKPAYVRFVDIAGLVRGASKGEGLGNRFLAHIREVNAILHVVRCFVDERVTHVEGNPDPVRDVEIVDTELILADIETVERRMEKVKRAANAGVKEAKEELGVLEELKHNLENGIYPPLSVERMEEVTHLNLLTMKPRFIVANYSKGGEKFVEELEKWGKERGVKVVPIDIKFELELAELSEEERKEIIENEERGVDKVIENAYHLLELITFYTGFEREELRAWAIKRGKTVFDAAGMVHSDMQKGFIKAEVIQADDLLKAGSEAKAREKGLFKSVGRGYLVRDGDLIRIKFR